MSKGQTLAILCVVVALGGRLEVAGDASEKIVARGARMVGGSETIIEKVPWQVSLVYESKGRSMCFCGGSIISSNWVITAAHCVDIKELERREQSIYVSAGSADYRRGSRHTIVDRIPHPKYELQMQSSEVTINDIALLEVIEAFVFDKTRQPIPLYVRAHATLSQSLAPARGWGDTKVDGGGAGFDLKTATLRITSVPVCNDFLSEAFQSSVVPTGQICSQAHWGTPCSGDSGGPLVVNGTLVGITSWSNGLSCSDDDFTVFTEVARYRYWISEMTLL